MPGSNTQEFVLRSRHAGGRDLGRPPQAVEVRAANGDTFVIEYREDGTTGDAGTTRSEHERPGRPAVRACSVLAPAVTGPRTRAPLMGAWRAPPRLPSSQTGKLMSISRRYGVPLTGPLRDHGLRGDSPGGPAASPAARLPCLQPPCPDPPLTGEGLPGAETDGAPRPRQDRRDAHGRRPPSSLHTPGGVRSFRLRGVPATLKSPVGRSVRFASVFLRLASETPHGTRWSTLGVLRSQGRTAAASPPNTWMG